jgi:predicted ribosome quality control (RQC) complex YloA/Tae2 family protein
MKTETVYFPNLETEIIYMIGKNQKENFSVIDQGQPEDIWFHAKEISSCHVIAILPEYHDFDKKELQSIIKRGALLCKEHTSKLQGYSNVEIIYTKIKNVIKTKTPGCVTTQNTKTIII